MNFLAHAYLSGDDPKILVGNFIGDFVKGRQAVDDFDAKISKGIALHRMIDDFTDNHSVVLESKKRLRPKYRHYAAVIVDVFYDHFLAAEWHLYHHQPLDQYSRWVYDVIESHDAILPHGVRYMMPYMVEGNWLLNYAKLEGIGRALTGMARRTPYLSKMDEAVGDLKDHYDDYKKEFHAFFPELVNASHDFIKKDIAP